MWLRLSWSICELANDRSDCSAGADASIQHLGREAVRRLLVKQYTSVFQMCGPGSPGKREENLPSPNIFGTIASIGSFLGLQGYETVVQQMYRRLLRLNTGFFDSPTFLRSLQLLRVVAAPGLGKVGMQHIMMLAAVSCCIVHERIVLSLQLLAYCL